MFNFSFLLSVFFFNRYGFADLQNTTDTIQYVIHSRLAHVFELFFLVDNPVVKRLCQN